MASILFSLTAWTPHLAADDVFHYFEGDERPVPRLSGSRLVGLVPFENRTGAADIEWVGEAMTSALAEMIEKGGGGVRILEGDAFPGRGASSGRQVDRAELERRKLKSLGIKAILRCEFRRSTRGVFRFSCYIRDQGGVGGEYAISECGKLDEIFEVQSRLSKKVCDALGLTVHAEEKARKVGIKAYEYFQRARSSPEGSYRKLHYCFKALEEDPGYVEARFCLAEAYYLIGISYGSRECMDRALREYGKVIAVDPRYARAHYKKGMIFFLGGDYSESRTAFERALELSPGMSEAKVGLRRLAEPGR